MLKRSSAPQGRLGVSQAITNRRACPIPTFPFVMQEQRLIGSLYGSGQPAVDIPRLVGLYQGGKLRLRELVTRTYRLDGVNDALAELASGADARGIIQW